MTAGSIPSITRTKPGWDGYLKETVSPQSTYTWYVHLVYLNGEEIEKIGVVHLMR